jgi:B-box zinc finger protein
VSAASGTDTEFGSGPVPCTNHPNVQTYLRCSNCGKPICPDCGVQSAVGIKCKDCARVPRSARMALTPQRTARAVGAAFGVGTLFGLVLGGGGAYGLGFFTFILAYVVGLLVGRATVRASGHTRSEPVAWIAVGGAAWAYIMPAVIVAIQTGGAARIGVQVLGLAIAGFVAYREVL